MGQMMFRYLSQFWNNQSGATAIELRSDCSRHRSRDYCHCAGVRYQPQHHIPVGFDCLEVSPAVPREELGGHPSLGIGMRCLAHKRPVVVRLGIAA